MQQLMQIWGGMPLRQRMIMVGATLVVFLAVIGLSRLAAKPSMSLLYAGLDAAAAGDVITSLEQKGIGHDIRGGAIYVVADQRDKLRMTLASEGLPANGSAGYELLDGLSGFGTTAAMFDAAYWRAKEGELARTIVATPAIQSARVHIANTGNSPFQRGGTLGASVSVITKGAALDAERAEALQFLIASAVSGLDPQNVVVVDSRLGIIGGNADRPDGRQAAQEEVLRDGVRRLLEARVGPGNVVVELRIERVTETETILERQIDPDSRVLVRSESEEASSQSQSSSADVSVASNVPLGEPAEEGGAVANNSQVRETSSYEISETQREIQRQAGGIGRLTVAVLVNGIPSETDPATLVPREESELDALRELVAASVGFSQERGDEISLKSMIFEAVQPSGTAAETKLWDLSGPDILTVLQMAILAVVVLALLLFVIRPLMTRPQSLKFSKDLPETRQGNIAIAPPSSDQVVEDQSIIAPSALPLDQAATDNPAERLRDLIRDRQKDSVEILRGWLDDSPEVGR